MKRGNKKQGLFLVFEGGEGSGKSTQVQRLARYFESKGRQVLVTREPGGTLIGENLRQLVVENRASDLSDRAELLIYEAARAQLVDAVLVPALDAGKVVICDRFMDSSTVYQGICKGLGRSTTQGLNKFATDGLTPDLVLLLDVPESIGMARVRSRKGPMNVWDKLDASFHRKVRNGFLSLARATPRRFAVIDASKSEDEIQLAITKVIEKKFAKKHL